MSHLSPWKALRDFTVFCAYFLRITPPSSLSLIKQCLQTKNLFLCLKTKHLWFITSVFSINKNGRKTSPTFYHYADNCFYSPFKSIFSLLEMDFLWDSQRGEIQPHTFRPRPDCMTHFCECYHNFNIQGLCTPSLLDWVFLTEEIGLRVCGMMSSDLTRGASS